MAGALIIKSSMGTEVRFMTIVVGYLIIIALSAWALKCLNRKISFIRTFSHGVIAALIGYIIASFLWPAVTSPGYYWGEIPKSVLILHWLITVLPLIVIALALLWSVKRQLNSLKKNI